MSRASTLLQDMDRDLPDMCKTTDLARATQIPVSSWSTWRYQGRGPEYLKLGGAVRYPKRAVIDWMRRRLVMEGE